MREKDRRAILKDVSRKKKRPGEISNLPKEQLTLWENQERGANLAGKRTLESAKTIAPSTGREKRKRGHPGSSCFEVSGCGVHSIKWFRKDAERQIYSAEGNNLAMV